MEWLNLYLDGSVILAAVMGEVVKVLGFNNCVERVARRFVAAVVDLNMSSSVRTSAHKSGIGRLLSIALPEAVCRSTMTWRAEQSSPALDCSCGTIINAFIVAVYPTKKDVTCIGVKKNITWP
jgi:hypothetical protein